MPPPRASTGGLTAIDSQTNALIAGRAAVEKQAEHVVVMDLRAVSTVTDFFVICTADSARQLNALKGHLETVLGQRGCPVWHTEGAPGAAIGEPQWVLLDCGEIVIHLLDPRARAFYRLEELWADAPRIPLPSGS